MPDSNPAPLTARQSKMVWVGAAMIAYGIISASVTYYNDANSLTIFTMIDPMEDAMVQVAIWVGIGAVTIFWYLIGPGSAPDQRSDGDEDRRIES
jgi:hypothetical protein